MSRVRGFTLLELLIGLSLLGLLLAVLFGGFRLASDSWDRVESRGREIANEQLGRAFVRRMVTQLQPLKWARSPEKPLAFFGQANLLHGIAPLSGLTGGLRVVQLAVEPATGVDGPFMLVVRQLPLNHDEERFDTGVGEAKAHIVLGGLAAAEFSYFGADKPDEPPSWRDTWANPGKLPRLIRLSTRMANQHPWPDLVVAALISGDRSAAATAQVGPF